MYLISTFPKLSVCGKENQILTLGGVCLNQQSPNPEGAGPGPLQPSNMSKHKSPLLAKLKKNPTPAHGNKEIMAAAEYITKAP